MRKYFLFLGWEVGRIYAEILSRRTKQNPPRILLVDDSEENRGLLQLYLKNYHIQIDHAESAAQSFKLLEDHEYDLILMDIQMPEVDGYQATKIIRESEHEKKITPNYIVACTAHAYVEDQERAIQAGCNQHLAKPVKKEQIIRVLNTYSVPLSEKKPH